MPASLVDMDVTSEAAASSSSAAAEVGGVNRQGCQMAKFDPFLSLDCARVDRGRGGAIQGKEGIKFCSVA